MTKENMSAEELSEHFSKLAMHLTKDTVDHGLMHLVEDFGVVYLVANLDKFCANLCYHTAMCLFANGAKFTEASVENGLSDEARIQGYEELSKALSDMQTLLDKVLVKEPVSTKTPN